MYVLIYGNPVDGLEFIGPFNSHETAIQHAETYILSDWWIAEMEAPLNA